MWPANFAEFGGDHRAQLIASVFTFTMLRKLHNHIFALKLRDVFVQSPLVLVYQTLGQVDHHGVKQQLQASLTKQLPANDVQVDLCSMKNTMAAATGDETLSRLFNNSNLLLGFKFPELQQQQEKQQAAAPALLQQQQQAQGPEAQQQAAAAVQQPAGGAEPRVSRGMSPHQVVGGLLEQRLPGPHLPQATLRALVELGVKLPTEQPLVLVGAFYKRSGTPLADLKQWIKLDATQVYGELLGTLESPVQGVLALEGSAQQLVSVFDAAAGDVAAALDYKAATQGQEQQ